MSYLKKKKKILFLSHLKLIRDKFAFKIFDVLSINKTLKNKCYISKSEIFNIL